MELRAENIGFRYGAKGREIWRNYNISIKSGERLGLMAPSGYGKTTLLKLLAGYERPDEGSVFLDGKPLSEYGGYCPVQLIWQHPEEALNPRLKMKHALKQGGGVSPRIAEGLGIQDECWNATRRSFPVGRCSASALRGRWGNRRNFCWRTKSLPCWT